MSTEQIRQTARPGDWVRVHGSPHTAPREVRRIKKRRDLNTHAFAYLFINVLVWGVWVVIGATSGGWFPWPLWVTLGWGVGLAFNGWDVYFRRPITEADILREMDRLRGARAR